MAGSPERRDEHPPPSLGPDAEDDRTVTSPTALYTSHVRPWTGELLSTLRLDVTYTRGEGDWLSCDDGSGPPRVLDALGGYGANLFGHHHPRLRARMVQLLGDGVPVQAQGSIRPAAAELARELSDRVGRGVADYVVTFANSGAETVEAALKHATLEWRERAAERRQRLAELAGHVVAAHPETGEAQLATLRGLGYTGGTRTADAVAFALRLEDALVASTPRSLALDGGFHGKTTGAVQLTHHAAYRADFDSGSTLFVGAGGSIEDRLAACRRTVVELGVGEHGPEFTAVPVTTAVALFVEPLQGEAGVRPLRAEQLQELAAAVRAEGVPLVLDEIQSGMGRTGTFCHSEQLGVRGDYVLLSKSLGGGLVKTGALLVERSRYRPSFGRLHSSTFAEDDLSSGVALEALRLLDDDDVPARAAATGAWLMARLQELRERHPGVVAEVRGAGLMIGIEFTDQAGTSSATIRTLVSQDLLGYVLAGYLLHGHGVRVAPTLSSPRTLRLEPSYLLTEEDAKLVVAALDGACEALGKANAFHLVRHLVDPAAVGGHITDHREPLRSDALDPALPQVAFAAHSVTSAHLPLFDPSLAGFTEAQLDDLMERIAPHVEPEFHERITVRSTTGAAVQLNFLAVFSSSARMSRALREDVAPVQRLLTTAVDQAVAAGCHTLGLGGYHSILTRNGRSLPPDRIALTTGNALTVGMGLRAIWQAADERGIVPEESCFAALGANGNIASVYSELVSDRVPRMLLVGRPGREQALLGAALRVYGRALRRLRDATDAGTTASLTGVAGVLAGVPAARALAAAADPASPGQIAQLHDALAGLGDRAPVRLATDVAALADAQLVLGASNAPDPLVFPDVLGAGPVVICDVSVPMDTDASVLRERPDVTVIQGGVVRLPENPDFRIGGMPLEPGHAFACMSETILLGLEGITEHYSYGRISAEQVEEITRIADRHGFALGRPKTEMSY